MDRLNILITTRFGVKGRSGGRTMYAVRVRRGWCDASEQPGRRMAEAIEVDGHEPDNTPERIRSAVARLRAEWGPLHVQDNSGLVPDLHQGLWNG